jgi:hypothetical protein
MLTTMDKEETGFRGNLGIATEHEDNAPLRKSFRGVIDEAEEEIMNSFASLVLKSDELLRMTMDGSAGKLGDDFDDDISSCYEEFEDDNDEDNEEDDDAHPLLPSRHVRFESDLSRSFQSQIIVHGPPTQPATPSQPSVIVQRPSGMTALPFRNKNVPVLVPSASASPKKESAGGVSTATDVNGKPKRPLSAYNLYFQLERERLVSTNRT